MSTKEEDDDPNQIPNASDALYVKIAAASVDDSGARSKVFQQEDLLSAGDIANGKELMPLIQYLTSKGLFRTLKIGGKLGWSVRPREAARQIVLLDRDEKTIYEIIEEAHTNGIWTRDLKKKTSIAQNVVTKALSKMEKNNLIKSVKSVKAPAQRTYMLSHLSPSEDVTGNSFFDAGDLDESFRDVVFDMIVHWVRTVSWAIPKKKSSKHHDRASPVPTREDNNDTTTSKKRKRPTNDIEDIGGRPKYRSLRPDISPDHDLQLAYLAGTQSYPTAEDIHRYLTTSTVIKASKAASLTVAEIQGCIDVLIWDDRLERIRRHDGAGWGYRTVKGVKNQLPGSSVFEEFEEAVGTGLTQAPCGHCPVFDLCHDSGPINAAECVYFEQWLKI